MAIEREVRYTADSKSDGPTYDMLRSLLESKQQLETLDIEVTGHSVALESDMNLDLLPSILSAHHNLKRLRIANCPNGACRPHVNNLLEAVARRNLVDLELHLQDTYTDIQFQVIAARNLLLNIGASCPILNRLALESSKEDVELFFRSSLLHLVPRTVATLELGFFRPDRIPWDDFRTLCSSPNNRLETIRIGVSSRQEKQRSCCSSSYEEKENFLIPNGNILAADDQQATCCPEVASSRNVLGADFFHDLAIFRGQHPQVSVTYRVK